MAYSWGASIAVFAAVLSFPSPTKLDPCSGNEVGFSMLASALRPPLQRQIAITNDSSVYKHGYGNSQAHHRRTRRKHPNRGKRRHVRNRSHSPPNGPGAKNLRF
uniref:Secreted protein n=1 Tax=Rhipicephalus appendiculatus TaxID=34631 RepID=A0A131Z2C7_RHIAP